MGPPSSRLRLHAGPSWTISLENVISMQPVSATGNRPHQGSNRMPHDARQSSSWSETEWKHQAEDSSRWFDPRDQEGSAGRTSNKSRGDGKITNASGRDRVDMVSGRWRRGFYMQSSGDPSSSGSAGKDLLPGLYPSSETSGTDGEGRPDSEPAPSATQSPVVLRVPSEPTFRAANKAFLKPEQRVELARLLRTG